MSRVVSMESGSVLGIPSEELVRESEAAEPNGAVCAYQDELGVWQYVPEHRADDYRQHLGKAIAIVWVE